MCPRTQKFGDINQNKPNGNKNIFNEVILLSKNTSAFFKINGCKTF